jgi:hypothetical protein
MSNDCPSTMRPTAANPLKRNAANARAVETLLRAAADDADDVSAFAVFDPNGVRFVGAAFVVRDHELAERLQSLLEDQGRMTPGKSVTGASKGQV